MPIDTITKSNFILRPAGTHIPQEKVDKEIAAARSKATLQTIEARKRGPKSKTLTKAFTGEAVNPFDEP